MNIPVPVSLLMVLTASVMWGSWFQFLRRAGDGVNQVAAAVEDPRHQRKAHVPAVLPEGGQLGQFAASGQEDNGGRQ